jgi:general secretion pathway protein G
MKGYSVLDNLSRIQRNRELNGERGFTLIELLIVIVVLGILAAVVVFALGGVTGQSSVAVSAYEASPPSTIAVGTPPATLGALVPNYLKAAPSNTAYNLTLDSSGNVLVALVSGDPGDPTTAYNPVGPGTTAEPYEGSLPYTFPTTAPSGTFNWPLTLAGKSICTGA